MKTLLLSCLFCFAPIALQAQPLERRCGWLSNPTPANWFLADRSGDWTISVQGGFEAQGMDKINLQNERDYVRTNGSYGYACACLDVVTKRSGQSWRITKIHSFKQLLLKQCLEDPALRRAPVCAS